MFNNEFDTSHYNCLGFRGNELILTVLNPLLFITQPQSIPIIPLRVFSVVAVPPTDQIFSFENSIS
jgi:hypothetical protein